MPARLAVLLSAALAVLPAAAGQAQDAAAPLRIRAVGDVMLGTDFPSPGHLPPDSALCAAARAAAPSAAPAEARTEAGAVGCVTNVLAAVAPLLRDADLTFVNLEGPLADTTTSTDKCDPGENCYAFRTPVRYGRFLAEAGVDLASLANNHATDFDEEGQRQTIEALEALGIDWSGPPGTVAVRSISRREGAGAPATRVGLAAFHTARSGNYLNDHDAAAALVDSLARVTDVTLVSFHGGAEGADALHVPDTTETFYGENRGHLRVFTRRVVDAGADLVLGHGPHVPRGMELYRGRLIAYSLGNFATYGRFNLSGPLGLGLILEAELGARGQFLRGRLLPTRQLGEGVPVPDRRFGAVRLVRRLTEEDFPGTPLRVLRGGRLFSPRAVQVLSPAAPVPPAPIRPAALPRRLAIGTR